MPTLYLKKARHSSIQFFYVVISLSLATPSLLLAQLIKPRAVLCGTASLTAEERKDLEAEAALALRLKKASGALFTTITYIPIRPHIIRKSDGTGGYTMASLNNVMALTNKYYLQNGNGIQFYFSGTTPDYINNDALYNQYRQNTDDATIAPYDVTNALNQYYVHQFDNGNLGGYARFPSNDVASTRTIILDENYDDDMGNRLVPHELGHTFNLLHTFESAYGYERVTRGSGANCTTTGDLICDTPADPYGRYADATSSCVSGCPSSYTCSFTDDQGNLYSPSPTNIMSYYYPCTHDFTAGQYDRIQAGLATRQSHTAYTLNAPPTSMAAPSNVVASILSNQLVITWQDNASNEMGYFIERSTSPTTGFVPIGGVEPNVTTFTDASFTPRTTYYYRIKASNTTTGSISTTASVVAPDCLPNFSDDGCPYSINITGVTVNNKILSQNSGCSSSTTSYYTSFTGVSGTVTAGQSATFTVTKGTMNAMGSSIWVDLNNNHVFEISERLYQMSAADKAATFSGTLAIPISTTASAIAMRIVAAFSTIPGDPCGSYDYGETEDYILVVKQPCTPPVASLSGTTTITTGQTATLTATLTGSSPFSLTVNTSNSSPITFTGITTSPFTFTVTPVISTTYTLANVLNGCATGTGSGIAVVTVNSCTAMYTLKVGSWDDPTVWSCNRLPTQTDLVTIGHQVTIPNGFIAKALQVNYTVGGQLAINPTGQLLFQP
ncbi:GEVED domain-containing protein [Spirosoma litoris]